jgi:glycine cleavage system H protein
VHHLLTCPDGVPAGVEEAFVTTFTPREQAWVKASMKSMFCVNLLMSTTMQGKLGSRLMGMIGGTAGSRQEARIENFPHDLMYHPQHMWVRADGTIGITFYAQEQLGDIVFVEAPEPGSAIEAGEPCGEIESCKSVSDLYAPVSGTIREVNAEVLNAPEIVNRDPYGAGWIARVDLADPGEPACLQRAGDYCRFIRGE